MKAVQTEGGKPIFLGVVGKIVGSNSPGGYAFTDDIRLVARAVMHGFVEELFSWWWRFAVAFLVLGLALTTCTPLDSTDTSHADRSGLRPRTDALTGCQYLESSQGALTPRLDAAGQPMCARDR